MSLVYDVYTTWEGIVVEVGVAHPHPPGWDYIHGPVVVVFLQVKGLPEWDLEYEKVGFVRWVGEI